MRRPHEVLLDYIALTYSRDLYHAEAGRLCREADGKVDRKQTGNITSAINTLIEAHICVPDLPPHQYDPCPHVEIACILKCEYNHPRVAKLVTKLQDYIRDDVESMMSTYDIHQVYDIRPLYNDQILISGSQISDRNKICPTCSRTYDDKVTDSAV